MSCVPNHDKIIKNMNMGAPQNNERLSSITIRTVNITTFIIKTIHFFLHNGYPFRLILYTSSRQHYSPHVHE